MSKHSIFYDIERDAPDLYEIVRDRSPRLASTIGRWRDELELPTNAKIGRQDRWYRLPAQFRTCCYELAENAPTSDLSSDVLTLRGSEPLLADYESYLEWMQKRVVSRVPGHADMGWYRAMADDVAVTRRKVPGAMTLLEAQTEASTGVALHRRHLECYGGLARAPVPILALRLSDETVQRVRDAVRSVLLDLSWDYVKDYIDDGLALYINWYPTAPIRLDQVVEFRFSRGGRDKFPAEFHEALDNVDVLTATHRWVELTARLLHMGWLPTTTYLNLLENTLQSSNVFVDGGFRFMGSLFRLEQAPNDEFIVLSAARSVERLRQVVAAAYGFGGGVEADALSAAVNWKMVFAAMQKEACDAPLHPKLKNLFGLDDIHNAMQIANAFHPMRVLPDYQPDKS